jgi:hypothetical protein
MKAKIKLFKNVRAPIPFSNELILLTCTLESYSRRLE